MPGTKPGKEYDIAAAKVNDLLDDDKFLDKQVNVVDHMLSNPANDHQSRQWREQLERVRDALAAKRDRLRAEKERREKERSDKKDKDKGNNDGGKKSVGGSD